MGLDRFVCETCENKGFFYSGLETIATDSEAEMKISIRKCSCDKAAHVNQIDLKQAMNRIMVQARREGLL